MASTEKCIESYRGIFFEKKYRDMFYDLCPTSPWKTRGSG
jgi:hypothetical protein